MQKEGIIEKQEHSERAAPNVAVPKIIGVLAYVVTNVGTTGSTLT